MQANEHVKEQEQEQDQPADRPRVHLRLREVLCLVGLALILGAATSYLIADNTEPNVIARVLVSDMIVGLPGTWVAFIVLRRLARIETTLKDHVDAELIGYNRGYIDCLKDRAEH